MTSGDQGQSDTDTGKALFGPKTEAELEPASHRSARRGITLAVVLLLVVAAVALIVSSGKKSPKEQLAQVVAFVNEHKTARIKGATVSRYGPGEDEVGSTSTDRSKLEGVIRVPDASRVVEDMGDFAYETLQVKGRAYTREADDVSGLDGEPWLYADAVEGASPEALEIIEGLSPAELDALNQFGGGLSSLGLPLDIGASLDTDGAVERVEPGKLRFSLTYRDFVPPEILDEFEQMLEAEGEDEDFLDQKIAVTVTHGSEGRLEELTLTSSYEMDGEVTDERLEVAFSRWGEPVDIAEPGDEDLDLTPTIDEKAFAEFKDFAPLAPAVPPVDYVLASATAEPADDEWESCALVDLSYRRADAYLAPHPQDADEELLYLAREFQVSQTERDCEFAEEPEAKSPGRPVKVGEWSAVLYDEVVQTGGQFFFDEGDGPPMRSLVITTSDTWITFVTGLDEAELLKVAATLAPLDLAKQPIQPIDLPKR